MARSVEGTLKRYGRRREKVSVGGLIMINRARIPLHQMGELDTSTKFCEADLEWEKRR